MFSKSSASAAFELEVGALLRSAFANWMKSFLVMHPIRLETDLSEEPLLDKVFESVGTSD